MKNLILIAVLCFTSSLVFAKKAKDNTSDKNCKEFLDVKDEFSPRYMAVIDGMSKSGKKTMEEVDVEGMVTETASVKEVCKTNKTKPLAKVRDHVATNNKGVNKKKFQPMKSKCADFLVLGEDVQPLAAFWVAGYDKTAKAPEQGAVFEEFISSPIVSLIEECKKEPKASFYAKAKNWVKKHI